MSALLLIPGLAGIIIASELFTNAVEWLGYALHMAKGATGSLLAAIGTSLPETIVPLLALISGTHSSNDLAAGAILGAPFLLYTLALCITGVALLTRRGKHNLIVEPRHVRRDVIVFLVAFTLAISATLLPHADRWPLAVVLVLIYLGYVRDALTSGDESDSMPEPLHLARFTSSDVPHISLIVAQIVVSLVLLGGGAELFIVGITEISTFVHMPTIVLALVLVPLATELPETLNSVVWIRSGSDSFAFGNVAGSAVFQACLLGALGIVATPWSFTPAVVISIGITWVSAVFIATRVWDGVVHGRTLALCGVGWGAYVVLTIVTVGKL